MRIAALVVSATIVSGCTRAPTYAAEVELTIDGRTFNYQTSKAQIDQQVKHGRYSLYLLPEEPDATKPYVCLRTYAGNPVAHLWVRYPKPGASTGDELGRYECFVPGILSNGTETLTWKRPDGRARDKTETGQPDCSATVTREGDRLVLALDALLRLEGGRKEGAADQAEPAGVETIRARGRAVLLLGATGG